MNAKKIFAGSMLTLAATGMASTPAVAYGDDAADTHGDYSQSIEIIRDVCPTVQDIDVLLLEVLDQSRAFQCNEIREKSAFVDNSDAPALPLLGVVH